MKGCKMALAMSALSCSGLAHAQSSVTIYGIVDAGVEYVNHASADGGLTRFVSGAKNTSRWGLRGVEDLGGGLKAVFQLESGFNVGDGRFDDDAIFGRRATVGLSSRFGQLTLGRMYTTTYDYLLPFDPMGYAQNYSWATSSTATGGRKDGMFTRSSNAVRYDGEFGGFKFGGTFGFGNVAGDFRASSKYGVGVGYGNGPFAAVATFDRQHGAGTSASPADTRFDGRTNYIQGIHAGLSYDFGSAKAMAGYRNYRRTFTTNAAGQLSDMYWLGGSYAFTPYFTLFGAVYHQNIKGASDADPTLFSLRAQYALSKRTVLYLSGGYAMADNDRTVSLSRDMTGAADTQVGVTAGLQHRF
ncbi:porin [Trinickia terrae]|uniref:Porin n=1 Tax=Trinickia terrae TaxID=2571161 RepID=A0A4U1IEW4_9BURK|nr:porin [Trinickia terrae]TKC92202.1 porin [Trinickia terrae]